jgi:hypothetical protein
MGQQPNIEIDHADRPRSRPQPAAAGSWSPDRPGDAAGPEDSRWGGGFGTQGPDAGYALTLLAGREIAAGDGETPADAIAAVAVLMMARAAHFGRGPVVGDAEVAEALLGYRPGTAPLEGRAGLIAGLSHASGKAAALLAAVGREALTASRDEVPSGSA